MPALAAGTRRFRGGARGGRLGGTPDEGNEAVERVLAVALLASTYLAVVTISPSLACGSAARHAGGGVARRLVSPRYVGAKKLGSLEARLAEDRPEHLYLFIEYDVFELRA
jgi:hypothetical protein